MYYVMKSSALLYWLLLKLKGAKWPSIFEFLRWSTAVVSVVASYYLCFCKRIRNPVQHSRNIESLLQLESCPVTHVIKYIMYQNHWACCVSSCIVKATETLFSPYCYVYSTIDDLRLFFFFFLRWKCRRWKEEMLLRRQVKRKLYSDARASEWRYIKQQQIPANSLIISLF